MQDRKDESTGRNNWLADYIDAWWRFLASVKLSVVLLLFLEARKRHQASI